MVKPKTGTVRSIDRNNLTIKILGPKNDNGYYRDKTVHLHCVNIIDQVKEEAFEFLRK